MTLPRITESLPRCDCEQGGDRPRVCPDCGRRDLWAMEPDAGGTELICHSCGYVAVSPFRAPPRPAVRHHLWDAAVAASAACWLVAVVWAVVLVATR